MGCVRPTCASFLREPSRALPAASWRGRPAAPNISAVHWACVRSLGFTAAVVSYGAVDRHLEGGANGAHAVVGKSAEPADQDRKRDAFDRVQVHRRTARDRVGIGFEDDFADEPTDRRRARCDQCAPMPRDHGVARQHNDRTPTDLGHLAPPDLPARRQRGHEAPAASRHDARSPHSSGSSSGCSS